MRVVINREITQRTVPIRHLKVGEFFRMAQNPGKTYIYLGCTPLGHEALRYYPETSGCHNQVADTAKFASGDEVTRLEATLDVKDA